MTPSPPAPGARRRAGLDIVAGMLGLDPRRFGQRGKRRTPQQEHTAVRAFLSKWQRFDWTRDLEGGEL